MFKAIAGFFRGVRHFGGETVSELKKSSWPTWKELWNYTIVVLVGIAILGLFTAIADFSLVNWIDFFTNRVK